MVTATTPSAAALDTSTSTSTRTSQLNSGASRDRFLKLLVAQLSNQDPLNPDGQRADDHADGADQHGVRHQQVNDTLGDLAAS